MPGQFGRKVSLFLANSTTALDLSNLKIRFNTSAADAETPNTAMIRVYNLSDHTVKTLNEYDRVILQAGYEDGNFGSIFDGTIKQYVRGKETNVDSFLDVMAADGDLGYNFGLINQSLAAGSSPSDVLSASAGALGVGVDPNAEASLTGGVLPRGKVLFGLARSVLRDLAVTNQARWSIQGGKLVMISLSGYLPGDILEVSSKTGMVGVPAATDNGVTVRILLNPQVQVGQRLKINNKDVNEVTVRQQGFPQYSSFNAPAAVSDDGIYRVLVAEHEGDTRGVEWYTNLICLAVDPTATPEKAVIPFG